MQTIDHDYQVLKTLGQGLAGEVFLVEKGKQKLALKLLKQAIANLSPQEAAAHFKAEFSILKQLSHPHIAKILDFGTDGQSDRHYYTSEFVDGGDIYAGTRKADPEQLEELFIQALRALEYLHTHRIPHFDIKPENLLLHQGKQVKIIDFGMAGFRPRGSLAGTPAYMAPEIVLGNQPDTRADLYSLGVTFYECAVGKNPFAAKGLSEMLRRQETLEPPPAERENPKLSSAFSEVLAQLLKKNPAERPATAGNALRLLARLSGKKISLETEATSLSYLPNETQLIGRSAALQAFQRNFDAAFGKKGSPAEPRLLVIVGPSGMGKTRFLKELRFRSQLAGVRTQNCEGAEIPEVHEAACLIYDDLNAKQIQALSLSLISIATPTLAIAATEEDIGEIAGAEILRLEPFHEEEIREYLSALTGLTQPPEALVDELLRRSQGSPRFLTEILEELIRQGALFDENGRWSAENIEDLGVDFSRARASDALEGAFRKDLEKLDQPARELLTWMALQPGAISAELLQETSSLEDLPYWILELLNLGYLQRDESSQAYRIANPYFMAWIEKNAEAAEAKEKHAVWAKIFSAKEDKAADKLYHLGRSGLGAESREALFELARQQSRKGLSQASLENLLQAEPLAGDDLDAVTRIQLKIGEELLALNRLPEALARFDALRDRLKKLQNQAAHAKMKVSAYEHLGAAYLRSNSLEKAKASFHAALTMMEEFELGDTIRRLVCENYLGRIHYLEGNLKEAEEIFQKSEAESRALTLEERRGVNNNDLGAVLLGLGKLEAASAHFEQELKFAASLQNEVLQLKCLYHLGEIESAKKNFAKGIEHFKRCVELAKDQKNLEMLLRAYNGLGNIHHTRSEYEESLKYYERALAISQKVQDFQSQAGIETNLGIILGHLNRLAEAVPHLKVAIQLCQSMGAKGAYERYFLATAKLELGDIHRREKRFDLAAETLHQAEALTEGQENLAAQRFAIRLARAKLSLDQGRREEAREILKDLESGKLDSDQRIEWTKVSNLLESDGSAASREPAITQANIESPRRAQSSVYLSQVAESEYAKLLELSRYINAETNLDFVLKNVLQYALELSGAERGLILLLNEHERLEVRASINTAMNPSLTEISSKVAEQALNTGEMVESDDATQDGRFNEYQSVMILKLRSILCLPIQSRNKTVGVLYLDHRYRPGAFHKGRYPLLQAFCDQAGIAIENAKLFEAYEKAQAQLKARLASSCARTPTSRRRTTPKRTSTPAARPCTKSSSFSTRSRRRIIPSSSTARPEPARSSSPRPCITTTSSGPNRVSSRSTAAAFRLI
ncbi:MAG: protein kinase [Deltaproteobacteria bacterium]|nr:protein kinase [Deltaproteobacteria bacterium]